MSYNTLVLLAADGIDNRAVTPSQSVLRVIFMGSPEFALPALVALHQKNTIRVSLVVCQTDKKAGRGQVLQACPVKQKSLELGLEVLAPTTLKDLSIQQLLKEKNADIFIVAAYGMLLPQVVLDIPRYGCLNIHASLLPKYRGAAPIAYALLEGEKRTGISLMRMEAGLDTGPVYYQAPMNILEHDTTLTLTEKLADLGASVLIEKLPDIISGKLPAVPQTSFANEPSYAPKLKKATGQLDFKKDALSLVNQIRALYPWPKAFFIHHQKTIQVLAAENVEATGIPGTVLHADKDQLVVACQKGALRILEVQPQDKKRMLARDWVLGRGISPHEKIEYCAHGPLSAKRLIN